MRVAITGAGGYVGSLLVRAHAARGDTVHGLARNAAAVPALPKIVVFAADLSRPETVSPHFFDGVDVVYHCAAELYREALMPAVNVECTGSLLKLAAGRIRHWVQLSSLSVYGASRSGVITEDSPLYPESIYARTKCGADALVAQSANGAFTYTLVRPSGIIGPNMRNRSIYGLIRAVDRGRFCFIGRTGAIGNYIHEENLVHGLMLCATTDEAKGRTYNLSQNCSIEQMIKAIADALGCPAPRVRIPEGLALLAAQFSRLAPGFPLTPARVNALTSRVEYPTDRLERELGYTHHKSMDEALRELVAAYGTGAG